MGKLQQQEGVIAVTDKSRPKVIADLFGVSKKTFKKVIGNLYKKGCIALFLCISICAVNRLAIFSELSEVEKHI